MNPHQSPHQCLGGSEARRIGTNEANGSRFTTFIQFSMPDNRAKYIATVLQAVILGAVTYYGVKWLVDAMDPTKKSRLAAQKQVGTCVM